MWKIGSIIIITKPYYYYYYQDTINMICLSTSGCTMQIMQLGIFLPRIRRKKIFCPGGPQAGGLRARAPSAPWLIRHWLQSLKERHFPGLFDVLEAEGRPNGTLGPVLRSTIRTTFKQIHDSNPLQSVYSQAGKPMRIMLLPPMHVNIFLLKMG